MEPELAQFESKQPNVEYLHVNIDEKDSTAYRENFSKYFKGRSIPYTVLVNQDGIKITDWTGYVAYGKLVDEIKSAGAK